jgi:TPR repeat protein
MQTHNLPWALPTNKRMGVPQNALEAATWYCKSADQGNAAA